MIQFLIGLPIVASGAYLLCAFLADDYRRGTPKWALPGLFVINLGIVLVGIALVVVSAYVIGVAYSW